MPARLSVILAQSSRRDSRTVELEEALVTQVMFTPGLDMTLVSALDTIRLDGTDHLCLQVLPQEVVVLAWLRLEDAATHWQRLALTGKLIDLADASATTDKHLEIDKLMRRVRYLRLSPEMTASEIVSTAQRVLDDRRIQVVPIQIGLSKPIQKSPAPETSAMRLDVPPLQANILAPPEPTSDVEISRAPANMSPIATALDLPLADQNSPTGFGNHVGPEIDTSDQSWRDIDRLVDDLDALDL